MISTKDKIKMLCIMNNTSINKLESECGFAKGYISKIDKSSPSSDNIQKLADRFLVNADYLITDSRTALCPICKFVYDPLNEPGNELHKLRHVNYVDACRKFGKIHDYLEVMVMPKVLKNIFTDVAYNEHPGEEYFELVDERLDREFSYFMWFEVYSYALKEEDEGKYRWEWKRNYIDENVRPSKELSLEICNYIRWRYELKRIKPEEVIENRKDFLYNIYKNIIVEDQAEHYFKLFVNLPPERRRNIYEQIVFQNLQMNKEEGEE